MITAESSTSIARQADDVFDFVSDLRNDPQWHTDVLEVQLTEEGPIHHGTIFTVRFKPFMGQSDVEPALSVFHYAELLLILCSFQERLEYGHWSAKNFRLAA